MKTKKLKALFKSVEAISKYPFNKVITFPSFYYEKTAEGIVKKNITVLATRGKDCLNETSIICKILSSIEPIKLSKEVENINKRAGFELLALLNGVSNDRRYLIVNTVYGAILLDVTIYENYLKD